MCVWASLCLGWQPTCAVCISCHLHLAPSLLGPSSLAGQAWEGLCCAQHQAERSYQTLPRLLLWDLVVQPTCAPPCHHGILHLMPSITVPLSRHQTSVKRAALQLSTQILGMLCRLGEFRMPCRVHPCLAPSLHAPPVSPDKREAIVLFSADCSVPAYAYLLRLGMLQHSPALPCMAVACVVALCSCVTQLGCFSSIPCKNDMGLGISCKATCPHCFCNACTLPCPRCSTHGSLQPVRAAAHICHHDQLACRLVASVASPGKDAHAIIRQSQA